MIAKFVSTCSLIAISVQPLAAQSNCVTKPEMRAGLTFIMPTLIDSVRTKCAETLPKTAYLISKGSELSARYGKGEAPDATALASLLKKFDTEGKMEGLSFELVTPIVSAMTTSVITKDIKPETCPTIDSAFSLLDPMPRENMFGLIELFVSTMMKSDAKKRVAKGKPEGILICEGSSR